MRLAVFTNQFPTPVSTFFARDMRGLIEAGIDIDVFSISPYDSTFWRYVPDILNERILPRNKIHHLTIPESLRTARPWPAQKVVRFLADTFSIDASAIRYGGVPFAKSSYVFIKAWAWARQFEHQFEHVLAYWGNYAGTCAYLFHRLAARPVPFSLFLHAGTDLYRTPVFMRQKLLYSDNIVTCSDFNEQYIRRIYPDIADLLVGKIYIHRHGLDLNEFSFELNGKIPGRIVAVGRFEREKGYEYLVKAAYQLKRQNVEVDIDFVGDGTEAVSLQSLSRELGVADRIKFWGWLRSDEARAVMKRASVLVHPSPDLGDGVPNVIKECMALGTPVIATRVAGIPELLGEGERGILVPPKDVDSLAEAITSLMRNPEMRRKYIYHARSHAEKDFDMWRNGESLSSFLRRTKPRNVGS